MTGQQSLQPERLLQCRKCKGFYGEDFYQLDVNGKYTCRRKLRCKGCMQHARTQRKIDGQRFTVKARSSLMNHGHRLARKGIVSGPEDLVRRFGWDVQRIAHDMEHAFENRCSYCGEPYSTMANGVGEVTLDIVDPKLPPYYTTNTKMCCQSCNREKAKTPPDRWSRTLMWHQEWVKQQARLAKDETLLTPLFDRQVRGMPI